MAIEGIDSHPLRPPFSAERLLVAVSSSALLVVTAAVLYLGVVVAVVIVGTSLGFKAVAGGTAYGMVAILIPVLVAIFLHRERGFSWFRAVRVGAGICLAVNLLLLPIAVAAMAM